MPDLGCHVEGGLESDLGDMQVQTCGGVRGENGFKRVKGQRPRPKTKGIDARETKVNGI